MAITTSLYIYAAVFLAAVFFIAIIKIAISIQSKKKIKQYQGEISKSHSRILKLEVRNQNLQKRIQELESLLQSTRVHMPN